MLRRQPGLGSPDPYASASWSSPTSPRETFPPGAPALLGGVPRRTAPCYVCAELFRCLICVPYEFLAYESFKVPFPAYCMTRTLSPLLTSVDPVVTTRSPGLRPLIT